MKLTESIKTIGRPIAYYPNVARWLGDVSTAVFLCQFIYWRGRVGDREIYKSRPEIEQETAIKQGAQKRICNKLQKQGLLKVVKKSMPGRNYYKFNWEEIDRQFDEWAAKNIADESSSEAESAQLDRRNPPNKSGGIGTTTSETTQETTTETTREAASPEPTGSNGGTPSKPKGQLKDIDAALWEHVLTSKQPSSTWSNFGKERKYCGSLAARSRELLDQTPYGDMRELITAVVEEYDRLKRTERSSWWRTAAWTPSQLLSHWSAIWESLSRRNTVVEVDF